jgi:hypothetical protein
MVPGGQLSSWCVDRRSESKCARSKGSNFHADKGNGPMHKRQQFSAFQNYLKDRERRIKRFVSAIEKRGVEGALDRCRMLVDQINRDLRVRRLDTSSMTSRRWQTFRCQLSVPPPCSMASRLMARMSGRLTHRINGKPLLSQLVMTRPLAGTTVHSVGERQPPR